MTYLLNLNIFFTKRAFVVCYNIDYIFGFISILDFEEFIHEINILFIGKFV